MWFGQIILHSETATLTGTFAPFGPLSAAVLRMQGRVHDVSVSDANLAEFGQSLVALPPHPEVPDGLLRLKAAGYRLVTLTNSSVTPSHGRLQAAGLADLFEQQFTAETVRRYKPEHQTYRMVAQATGTELPDLCMIASHPWDLIGARAAGCSAALLTHAGVAPFIVPGLPQPQVIAPTLTDAAAQLVALKHA